MELETSENWRLIPSQKWIPSGRSPVWNEFEPFRSDLRWWASAEALRYREPMGKLQKQGMEDGFYIFYIVLHVFTSWTSFSHIFTIFHILYFSPIFQVGAGDSQPCCWKSVSYWRLWAYGISKSIAVISWQHLGRLGRVGFPWLLNLYVCSSGMCVAMFEI